MASSARIDELRKKFDENPRRYFAPLANEYRKAGDLEQAIFICQEYLPQQPGHMSGHIVYGQALFELNRLDEARQVFETALSLDPENLIALRHLGDIARQTGDSRGARGWYQRVLEADPRNEEIAQIMMTLLATPDYAQPAVTSTPTPIATPTVPAGTLDQASIPTDPIGFRPADLGVEVEKSQDNVDLSVGPELSALPERQEPPVSADFEPARSREQIPDSELLDLDEEDFSIGGIPMRELGLTPSIQAPAVVEQPRAEAESPEVEAHEEETLEEEEVFTESPSVFVSASTPAFAQPIRDETPSAAAAEPSIDEPDFAIEKDHPPFEADPYAIASAPVLPEVELSPDITLELPDDGTTPTLGDTDNLAVLGLETFEHGIAAAPPDTSALEFDSFFATPTQTEAPAAVEAIEPAPVLAAAELEAPPTIEEPVASFEASFTDFEIPPAVLDTPAAQTEAQDEPAVPAAVQLEESLTLPELEPDVAPEPEAVTAEMPIEPEAVASWTVTELEPVLEAVPVLDVLEIEPLAAAGIIETEAQFEPAAIETQPEPELEPEPEPASAEAELPPEQQVEADLVAAWDAPVGDEAFLVEAAPSPEAFVTETMAKLYLEQGHLEAALGIYQKLVEQRPFDDALVARLQEVEAQVNGPVTEPEPELESVAEEAFSPIAPAIPTIRDFLGEILRSVPRSMYATAEAPAADELFESSEEQPLDDVLIVAALGDPSSALPPEDTLDESVFADETQYEPPVSDVGTDYDDVDISVEALPPIESEFGELPEPTLPSVERLPTPAFGVETRVHRATPAIPGETVSGSIDALFSGAGGSSSDAAAADNLAQAFAPEGPDTKPLQGMPAHKASNELLLDHVFKTVQPPRAESESEGFSFDQFFAQDVGDTPGQTGADSASAPGQTDDIAQFNNWLNGLKKS